MNYRVYCVIRQYKNFEKNNQASNQDFDNLLHKAVKNVGSFYFDLRKEITKISEDTLKNKFEYVFYNLEEFESNIEDLRDSWVYFTDNDDWCLDNLKEKCSDHLEQDLDLIVWNHVKYESMHNNIVKNLFINCNLQTNHSLIKINDNFLNFKINVPWNTTLLDKCQHWYQQSFYNPNNKKCRYVEINDYYSIWNRTPLSISWSKELWCTETFKDRIYKYINEDPHIQQPLLYKKFIINDLIKKQKEVFKKYFNL